MSIGNRVKEVRKHLSKKLGRKITQEVLGEELGIGRDAVSNIETGRVDASPAFINNLCNTYKIDRVWLETGDPNRNIDLAVEDIDSGYIDDLLEDIDNPFYDTIRAILKVYAGAKPADQDALKRFARSFLDETKKENQG